MTDEQAKPPARVSKIAGGVPSPRPKLNKAGAAPSPRPAAAKSPPAKLAKKPKKDDAPDIQAVMDAGWAGATKAIGALTPHEAMKRLVGFPLPSLSAEYLLATNIMPFGRLIQLIGHPGACKSSLLFELQRWGMLHDGFSATKETEQKDIPYQRAAIFEHNPEWCGSETKPGRSALAFANSMEQWQAQVTEVIKKLTQSNEGKLRPEAADALSFSLNLGPIQRKKVGGWRVPYILGVDSVMATAPMSQVKNQMEDGHAKPDFARAAGLLSRYMQGIPHLIRDTSLILVATNHNKPGVDFFGNPVDRAPGGQAFKFMETFEIVMNRGAKIVYPFGGGITVSMTTIKNAMGEGNRTIEVPMVWSRYQDEQTGRWLQQSYWDWNAATATMLVAFQRGKGGKPFWDAINDIVDVRQAKGKTLWSKRLGIAEDEAVGYHEFGRRVDTDVELRRQLWPILGITKCRVHTPGRQIWETWEAKDPDTGFDLPNRYPVRDLSEFGMFTDRIIGNAKEVDEVYDEAGNPMMED